MRPSTLLPNMHTTQPMVRTLVRGYIALVSTLIICAILSALVFTLGTAAYFTRMNSLDEENYVTARTLADSCAQVAFLKLGQGATYRPASTGDLVWVDPTHTCTIDSVAASRSTYTIHTHARVLDSVSATEVIATLHPGATPFVTIRQWKE